MKAERGLHCQLLEDDYLVTTPLPYFLLINAFHASRSHGGSRSPCDSYRPQTFAAHSRASRSALEPSFRLVSTRRTSTADSSHSLRTVDPVPDRRLSVASADCPPR